MAERPRHSGHEHSAERPEIAFAIDAMEPMYDLKIPRADGLEGDIVMGLRPDRQTDNTDGDSIILLVRYPDGSMMTAGMHRDSGNNLRAVLARHIPEGVRVYYGSHGDSDIQTEVEVLGAEAMMGIEGRRFGEGVAGIHGSIEIKAGRLIVRAREAHSDLPHETGHIPGADIVTAESVTPVDLGSPTERARQMLAGIGDRTPTPPARLTPADARKRLEELLGPQPTAGAAATAGAELGMVPEPDTPNVLATPADTQHDAESVEPTPGRSAEIRRAQEKACQEIAKILGTNGKGGDLLGDALRGFGSSPAEIRARLDRQKGDPAARDKILRVLYTRANSLFQGKVFLSGVDAGRDKPIPKDLGYDVSSMESVHWVAMLALARMDGSWREDFAPATGEDTTNNGHHRDAAEKVLASFAKEQVEDKVQIDLGETLNALRKELSGYNDNLTHFTKQYAEARTRLLNHTTQELNDIAHRRVDTGLLEQALGDMQQTIYHTRALIGDIYKRVQLAQRMLAEHADTMKRAGSSDEELFGIRRHVDTAEAMMGNVKAMDQTVGDLEGADYQYRRVFDELQSSHYPESLLNELFRRLRVGQPESEAKLRAINQYMESML